MFSSSGSELGIVIKIDLITCSIVDLEILVQLKFDLPRHPICRKENFISTVFIFISFCFSFHPVRTLNSSLATSLQILVELFSTNKKLTFIAHFRKGPVIVVISMCPWSARVFITIVSDLQWIVFRLKDKSEMLAVL